MIRPRRLLPLLVTLVAVTVGAAGCDSSPVAATVNGQEIKQTALQVQLRSWAHNRAYIQALAQANAQSGSQTPVTVTGSAPGTYSAPFSTFVLDGMVEAAAIHQYLLSQQELPSPAALAAARSALEADRSGYWLEFPAAFRNEQTVALADQAALQPAMSPADTAAARAGYMNFRRYFFSRICTRLIAVSVPGVGGRIDFAASQAKAERIRAHYRGGPLAGVGATAPVAGVTCYTPAQLENQSLPFFNEVLALAPGQAAPPQRTSYGYTVLVVDSRTVQPFSPDVAKVIGLLQAEAQGNASSMLIRVLTRARVSVNPAFGSWNRSQLTVQASTVPFQIQQKLQATGAQPASQS